MKTKPITYSLGVALVIMVLLRRCSRAGDAPGHAQVR
jgi:hypothetical protein